MENDYNYSPGSESNNHNIRNIIFAILVAVIVAVGGYTIYLVAHKKSSPSKGPTISKSTITNNSKNSKPATSTPKAPSARSSNNSTSTSGKSSAATTNSTSSVSNSTAQLSNTGPGSVIGIFAVAACVGFAAHYIYQRRRATANT